MLRHSSKGRPTLEARHHHRNAQIADHFEKRLSGIVIRIDVLMARVDQHALKAVIHDRPLQLFEKRRSAAGQGAGEDEYPALIFLLNLGSVLVPAPQESQRFLVVFSLR